MVKKVTTGLFVCMFVFAFSFVSIAVSEQYSGTAKIKGKLMGLEAGKGELKQKCTIRLITNDMNDTIQGAMVYNYGGKDELTFLFHGNLGDQAFYADARDVAHGRRGRIIGDARIELRMAGKVKVKNDGKIKLEGTLAGIDLKERKTVQGKINAELAPGQSMFPAESMPED